MKYKLVGKCGDKEVEFDSIKNAILSDMSLYDETGESYQFTYNNKLIQRLRDVDKALDKKNNHCINIYEEMDYLKCEIGFIDNFSNCIYTGAEMKDKVFNLSVGGCSECGNTDVQVYYIYDLMNETKEKKALCKECYKEYKQSGFYRLKKLEGQGKYVKKGKNFN